MDLFEQLFDRPSTDDSDEIRRVIDAEGKTEEVKPPPDPGDRIRASGIEDFCPRFEALRHRDGIALREKTQGRLNRIFKDGRVFERALRDSVFGKAKLLIGTWSCISCGALSRPWSVMPTRAHCPAEGRSDHWTYEEPFGMIDGTNIGGSGDGFILWKGERCLLEVKTSKDQFWREIARVRSPLTRHVSQAQVYLEVFGLKRCLFWYYNKNTSEHLPLWMTKSDDHVKKMVAKDAVLKDYFKTGLLPDRICSSPACSRAKECSLKALCFRP